MDHLFSVFRKPLKCEPPHFERVSDSEVVRPIATISTQNIIAFSSATDLMDTWGSSWGGHVYVCDLNTPWDCHKVCSTCEAVSALTWDEEGRQLCVGTAGGEVQVLGQKDFLLNSWTVLYSQMFIGEQVLKAIFFTNGRHFVTVDKKADAPITERIQLVRSSPTCKGFGGVAEEGVFVILSSGMCASVTSQHAHSAPLRQVRAALASAHLVHSEGTVLACVVSRGARCVRCCACTVTAGGVRVRALPALHLSEPAQIAWVKRADGDHLLVAGKTIQVWKLTEKTHPLHKLCTKVSGNTTPGGQKTNSEAFSTLVWQQVSSVASPSPAAALSADSRRRVGVCVTQAHVHLLHYHNYTLTSAAVCTENASSDVSSPKKAKYGNGTQIQSSAIVCGADISYLNALVVVIDSRSQLHAYTVPQPWTDAGGTGTVGALELGAVSGWDVTDVLLALRRATPTSLPPHAPHPLETLADRLTESFQRHPPAFQQYYFQSWLMIRAAICRLVPHLQSSAASLAALSALQALHAAATAAAAAKLEDTPALDEDHDKGLSALEAKSEPNIDLLGLTLLRRPLQRAFDQAATLLASLTHVTPNHAGYELYSDPSAIILLRKLIVMGRTGRTSISDALQRLPGPITNEYIEECATLAHQLTYSSVWENLPRCGLTVPHANPPHNLEYFLEPELLQLSPERPAYLHAAPAAQVDTIRYTYLGGDGPALRSCGRCGARSAPRAPAPAPPMPLAQRYAAACRCGGKWTLTSSTH